MAAAARLPGRARNEREPVEIDRQHDDHPALRVGFVAGVIPDKWARIWAERMPTVGLELALVDESSQTDVLYDGRADMCFARLPVHDERLHVIGLYTETPVVVVPKGHFVEAAGEVSLADLVDEQIHPVPPLTVKQAVETVAAGAGVVVLPQSLARLHHRKDVVHRPVADAEPTRIALVWRRDLDDERVETFIGVVRGRSANSSRGPAPAEAVRQTRPKRSSAGKAVRKPAPSKTGRTVKGRRRR
jgi:DNA-binding transcriptional LysR family regulator